MNRTIIKKNDLKHFFTNISINKIIIILYNMRQKAISIKIEWNNNLWFY
jgi:hypothetical protein